MTKNYISNSEMIVVDNSDPRLNITKWGDIKSVGLHGIYSIYTAVRYGRKYFIKSLAEKYRELPEWQRLLFKEFELGIKLDHPGIARTVSWETIPGIGEAIVMEFVDGQELRLWLNSSGCSRRERLKIVIQITEALSYIHSLGISHRDLKPDNILVTHKGGFAKIIDFGLGDADDFVVYKQSVGTESFGAPEQTGGQQLEASMAADIYSLGKIMKTLLPELKYRRLIGRCLRHDSSARPTSAQVLKSLNKKDHTLTIAILLIAALAIAACGIYYNRQLRNNELLPAQSLETTIDTIYIQRVDTVRVEVPGKPSEAAIKAVWVKAIKDIDPQIEFYATFDFPNPEEHVNDIDNLIRQWQERFYYSFLGIGCTEEFARAKRSELESYMRSRAKEFLTDKHNLTTPQTPLVSP